MVSDIEIIVIALILPIYIYLFNKNRLIYSLLIFLGTAFIPYDFYHNTLSFDVVLGRIDIMDIITIVSIISLIYTLKSSDIDSLRNNRLFMLTNLSLIYIIILGIQGYVFHRNDNNFILNDIRMVLYYYCAYYFTSMVKIKYSNLEKFISHIPTIVYFSCIGIGLATIINDISLDVRINDPYVLSMVGLNFILLPATLINIMKVNELLKLKNIYSVFAFIISLIIILIPLVRGIIISSFLSISILLFLFAKKYGYMVIKTTIKVIVVLILFFVMIIHLETYKGLAPVVDVQRDILINRLDVASENFQSNRIEEIIDLLRQYDTLDLIVGRGLGGAYDPTNAYKWNPDEWWRPNVGNLYLHVNYFSIVLKGGFLGLLFFIFFWIKVSSLITINNRTNIEQWYLNTLFLVMIINSAIVNFFDPTYTTNFCVFIGTLSSFIGSLSKDDK